MGKARLTPEEALRRKRERARKWRNANKARQGAYMKKWRKANAEDIKAYNRASANRKAYTAKWRKQNRPRLREYANGYYAKNTDTIKAQLKASYRRNKASRLVQCKKYYEKNKQAIFAMTKSWRARNPEKAKEITKRSVLKRRSASLCPKFSYSSFYARCEFFGWRCRYCGKHLTKKTVTIEHQIPLSKGGNNMPSNLVPACEGCNKSKNGKTLAEWRARQAIIASPAVP